MRLIAFLFFAIGLVFSSTPALASAPASGEAARLVSGWAEQWQSQDFEGYAGLYSPQFSTSAFRDRQAWLSFRQPRVEKPKSIEVRIYDLRVLESSPDRMLVEFVQFYASDRLRVYSLKKQVWTREGDAWRIRAEEAVDLPKRHAVVREGLERPLALAPLAAPQAPEPIASAAPEPAPHPCRQPSRLRPWSMVFGSKAVFVSSRPKPCRPWFRPTWARCSPGSKCRPWLAM